MSKFAAEAGSGKLSPTCCAELDPLLGAAVPDVPGLGENTIAGHWGV
jgi:hypothetical protein